MPSPMVTWPMTSRDPKRSNSWPQNLWSPVSPYPCKIHAWSSLITNRKVPTPSPMVTWQMPSRDPKRSRSWPQYLWSPVSPYLCKIDTWLSLTTNIKDLSLSLMVTFRWRHVTPKDQNFDPKLFKVQCLHGRGKQMVYNWPSTWKLCYCNKTANINVQNISLYTC